MLDDIDNMEVPPKVFAKMMGTSMTKLFRGDYPVERAQKVEEDLKQIRVLTNQEPYDWLTQELPVDIASVTPLDVWRYGPDIESLIDDPVQELDRVCKHWRLLYRKKGAPLR